MLTTSGFSPFETREDWPLSSQLTDQYPESTQKQFFMDYYLSDGWVWHVDPDIGPRRVCWLPSLYRDAWDVFYLPHFGEMTAGHKALAVLTRKMGLVILDLSKCH